jgi:hypothetical protein
MSFKLLTHQNQHGFGVSLTKHDAAGNMEDGFVLNSFEHEHDRLKYLSDLAKMTGFEIERLN